MLLPSLPQQTLKNHLFQRLYRRKAWVFAEILPPPSPIYGKVSGLFETTFLFGFT